MATTGMIRPKFYIGRRDTRWDVYPQPEPEQVVAHDASGFWAKTKDGRWYKSPASFHMLHEISEEEANKPLA